ncbi:MAG: hypothetical protein WC867_00310 [Candidatus Pacearchaeota archaeon]|jgi:hypothetical protein
MILTLIGLILNFIGSAYLVYDNLTTFGKPKSVTSIIYHEESKPPECIRYKRLKGGWLKQVKITPEEIKLIISFSLISLGFLLQILDFIPKEIWINLKF